MISLAILGAFIFLLAARRGSGAAKPKSAHEEPVRKPEPKSTIAASEPPPFDARTATPLTVPLVLKGNAYVVDGDTLTIQKTQIRLFGIDAPELDHPYGKNAKSALISLCKGQSVRAEVVATDDHGRTVAQCYLPDGRDLSAEMVRCGLALDWQKYSGGRYRLLEAPDARRKLWLADARQKGRMEVWEQFEAKRAAAAAKD